MKPYNVHRAYGILSAHVWLAVTKFKSHIDAESEGLSLEYKEIFGDLEDAYVRAQAEIGEPAEFFESKDPWGFV